MTDWLRESWSYVLPWAGFLGAAIVAIRAAYAAERDRDALGRAELEREKLVLEIGRLRNSPDAVAERRAVYHRLRKVLSDIISTATADIAQIGALQEVRHDSAFCFPTDVTESMRAMIESAVALYVSNKTLERGPYLLTEDAFADAARRASELLGRFEPCPMSRTMKRLTH